MLLTVCRAEDAFTTMGYVNTSLLVAYLNAEGAVSGLYVDSGGLYLLPESVPRKGQVRDICAYGYTSDAYIKYYTFPNSTEIDVYTSTRPFVYIVLFRRNYEDEEYSIVFQPALLHHHLYENCLTRSDGLNWQVEVGDRIGVFIPSKCIMPDDVELTDVFVKDEVKKYFAMLCPSQINIIALPGDNSLALFANDTFLSVEDIKNFTFKSDKEFATTSARINMNVTIEQQGR